MMGRQFSVLGSQFSEERRAVRGTLRKSPIVGRFFENLLPVASSQSPVSEQGMQIRLVGWSLQWRPSNTRPDCNFRQYLQGFAFVSGAWSIA